MAGVACVVGKGTVREGALGRYMCGTLATMGNVEGRAMVGVGRQRYKQLYRYGGMGNWEAMGMATNCHANAGKPKRC